MDDGLPVAMVATARAGGTIAAVRSLGSCNIPVEVLTSQHPAAAAWSRHAAVVHRMPAESDPRFVDRLCELGQLRPGGVLLPTSDQTAWLYASEAKRLGACFHSYQPAPDVLATMLDKARLADAARRADVPVLDTWAPSSLHEVAGLAPKLSYPILIKPRSHIDRLSNNKGRLTHSADELVSSYERVIHGENEAQLLAGHEAVDPPILQRFVSMGREGVHSVSGFIDRSGALFTTRISAKVFLRMYPVGVGVCYESRPPNPELSDAVYRLCREVGYHGVFEVEFMPCGGRWAAIDFNPRLFSQVGLDIARGMPLPHLLWLAALDRQDELQRAVKDAEAAGRDEGPGTVLYDRFTLSAMLIAMALTSRAPKSERVYWRQWRRRHAHCAVHYAWDPRDPLPAIVHAVSELGLGLKALPRFLRGMIPGEPAVSPRAQER